MTRNMLITLFALLLLSASVAADDTIKVLILEKGFMNIPVKDEKLAKLDEATGNLTLGMSNFSGNIEVWKGEKGLYLINNLPLEEYVEGVVKAETGKEWALEALKAQAVIVRTYVLNQKANNSNKQFHVTSSVLHQLYRGKNSDSIVADAVIQTKGQILAYDGKPIIAYYHSTSSGTTELPEEVFSTSYPYLKSVTASGKLSPYSMWIRKIPISEIETTTGTADIASVEIKSRTSTGRAKEIALITEHNDEYGTSYLSNKTVLAKDLRKMLGWKRLPSTDFNLTTDNDIIVFEGKGYGHGVGLCQWTALEMALEGKDYKEILSHFYPGATLINHEDL